MSPHAFKRHLVAELDAVYRMAVHLTRDPDEAADLAQETYKRALDAADQFELRDHGIRPWLLKILQNCFYSQRKRARRGPVAVPDLQDQPHAAADDAAGDDAAALEIDGLDPEQLDDRLKHAIESLPDAYRVVLLLWAVEGLKYREIADALDVPIGTVMSRLSRARRHLSADLQMLAQETGVIGRPALAA